MATTKRLPRYVRFPLWISGQRYTAMISRAQINSWDVCRLLKDAFPHVIVSWRGDYTDPGRVNPGDEIILEAEQGCPHNERADALAWAKQAFAAFGCVLVRQGPSDGGFGTYQWVFALPPEPDCPDFDARVEMT